MHRSQRRMTLFAPFCFAATLALAVGTSHAALASSPTLTATMRWLVSHLPTDIRARTVMGNTREYAVYSASGCRLQIVDRSYTDEEPADAKWPPYKRVIVRLEPNSGQTISFTHRDQASTVKHDDLETWDKIVIKLDLATFDPSHIQVRTVTINNMHRGQGTIDFDLSPPWLSIPFLPENEALAQRVARAFRHAMELCGATAEPF